MTALPRLALVVGTTTGGTGTHVRMLAAGCASRGLPVTVLGPSATGTRLGFASLPGVVFTPVEFTDRPRPRDALAVLRLRRALRPARAFRPRRAFRRPRAFRQPRAFRRPRAFRPDVVHAHGLRAGALTVLALGRVLARGRGRPRLVVTVHNAPPAGGRTTALIYGLLERLVARRADLVLCVSSDLETRVRSAGARRVGRAVIAAPTPPPPAPAPPAVPGTAPPVVPDAAPLASARGRPIVLAAGRLAPQKGFGTLIEAAVSWRDMDPEPVLVIAGDGPLAAPLRAKAASLGVAARLPGHRDDLPALLAAAAVFVLPSRWEGQPLVLQEALRAGLPIVASRAGGIPGLTGEDAALLVPPGDPVALAGAVRAVLTDPALAGRLRAAARARAAGLPSADVALAAALTSYAR